MSFGIALLIILILTVLVVVPIWPYSKGWGLRPGCVAAFCLVVVLFLLETGDL
jgi:Protein of unknown function (DUF3309)